MGRSATSASDIFSFGVRSSFLWRKKRETNSSPHSTCTNIHVLTFRGPIGFWAGNASFRAAAQSENCKVSMHGVVESPKSTGLAHRLQYSWPVPCLRHTNYCLVLQLSAAGHRARHLNLVLSAHGSDSYNHIINIRRLPALLLSPFHSLQLYLQAPPIVHACRLYIQHRCRPHWSRHVPCSRRCCCGSLRLGTHPTGDSTASSGKHTASHPMHQVCLVHMRWCIIIHHLRIQPSSQLYQCVKLALFPICSPALHSVSIGNVEKHWGAQGHIMNVPAGFVH